MASKEEIDPLDAFMADLAATEKRAKKKRRKNKVWTIFVLCFCLH